MSNSALRKNAFIRGAIFSLASNAAVLFVLKFGQIVWPEGLPAHSQNAFWLASGVNVAGLLILGLRYWPVILLDAIPAWWLAGEPLDLTALGSATNALEALLAAWMIRRLGGFAGSFERMRPVVLLLIASLVAPLINTLVIPVWFCIRGLVKWENYPEALGNWNLANGTAMLMVAPLLLAIRGDGWAVRGRWKEGVGFAVAAVVVCTIAFDALFSGAGLNLAFLVFPLVIYAAMRFGMSEVSVVAGIVLIAIYGSLASHAHASSALQMSSSIWFAQAFCWVLSATGFLVAALVFERRRAEDETRRERERSLEGRLNEERARLDALRYQLNPHFLFNSLNSIYSTLPATGAEVSRKMLTQLSGYLRSALAGGKSDTVPLREELRAADQYLAIERNRFGDDLRVTITADETALGVRVPAFLLQPLVENAIVHGFTATQGVFQLEIRARLHGSRLFLEIANTGDWKARPGEGVGLSNTRSRLGILHGEAATFEIENSGGWVRVSISLPAGS